MSGSSVVLQVIPFAIGAAISPAVLTVQILVLSSGEVALARGWGLALGRMTTLLLLALGGVSLLVQLPDFGTGQPSMLEVLILLAAGVALGLVAMFEARRPRRASSTPSFAKRVVDANPLVLFAIGAGWMLINASTLALYIPGLHVITSSDADLPFQVLAFAILFICASAVALLPTLGVTLYGERAQPVLERIHTWVERWAHTITIAVCGLFGIGLIAYAGKIALSLN